MLKRFCLIVFLALGYAAHAATILPVNVGSPNAGDGDSFRAAMVKVNTSLTNLNNSIGGTNAVIPATFGTVLEMALSDPAGYLTNIYVAGYYTIGDGGGGNFYGSPSSAATTNRGTIIKPPLNPGRWIRVVDGPLNPKWFGAKGDGTTDDYAAIRSCWDAMPAYGNTTYTPPGTFVFGTQLIYNPPDNANFVCEGMYQPASGMTGTALTIGTNAGAVVRGYKIAGLRLINPTVDWTNNLVGIKAWNLYEGNIDIKEVGRFATNFALLGASGNNPAYNEIRTRLNYDAKSLILLGFEGSGSCNENYFMGGRLCWFSGLPSYTDCIGIHIADSSANNNRFMFTSIEGGGSSVKAAYFGGVNNVCLFPRLEGTGHFVFPSTSINNEIQNGYGVNLQEIEDSGLKNKIFTNNEWVWTGSSSGAILRLKNTFDLDVDTLTIYGSDGVRRGGWTGRGMLFSNDHIYSENGYYFKSQDGSNLDRSITTGTGSPETVLARQPGSIYLQSNGGVGLTLWVKETGTGNTGWSVIAPNLANEVINTGASTARSIPVYTDVTGTNITASTVTLSTTGGQTNIGSTAKFTIENTSSGTNYLIDLLNQAGVRTAFITGLGHFESISGDGYFHTGIKWRSSSGVNDDRGLFSGTGHPGGTANQAARTGSLYASITGAQDTTLYLKETDSGSGTGGTNGWWPVVTMDQRTANTFLAGPATGSSGTSLFRTLAVNDFNAGSGASSSTVWCGDGTWKTPPGASGGETNTASNLGTGVGIFSDKSSIDLRFNSIAAGSGITVVSNASTITITATGGGGGGTAGTVINTGASVSGQLPVYSDTTGTNIAPTATVTVTTTNVAFKGGATFNNITLTNALAVGGGGSGAATFTAHGPLFGEGTSAFGVGAVGTSGQPLLSGGASADGAYGALDVSSAAITGVLKAAAFPALTGDITTASGALATTLKATGTAGTYTKTTFDAQGRETSGTSATLASSDYANQGTTVTVLHGNASGNPSWAAVNLANDTTGTTAIGNGGTGQTTANTAYNALSPNTTRGDITVRGASVNARFAIGTANQVLGVNNAGTDHEYKTITAGTGVTVTHAAGTVTIAASGGQTPYTSDHNAAGYAITNLSRINFGNAWITKTSTTNCPIDASAGRFFQLNCTVNGLYFPAPTNAQLNDEIEVSCNQDASGPYTVSFATNWIFSDDITGIAFAHASKTDVFKAQCINPTNGVWRIKAFIRGFAQ